VDDFLRIKRVDRQSDMAAGSFVEGSQNLYERHSWRGNHASLSLDTRARINLPTALDGRSQRAKRKIAHL